MANIAPLNPSSMFVSPQYHGVNEQQATAALTAIEAVDETKNNLVTLKTCLYGLALIALIGAAAGLILAGGGFIGAGIAVGAIALIGIFVAFKKISDAYGAQKKLPELMTEIKAIRLVKTIQASAPQQNQAQQAQGFQFNF